MKKLLGKKLGGWDIFKDNNTNQKSNLVASLHTGILEYIN